MNYSAKTLYPLSHPQKRIWYTECMHPASAVHNIGGCVRFHGAVDMGRLEAAIHTVLCAHEGHRMQLTPAGEDVFPRQYVARYRPHKLTLYDFSRQPDPEGAYSHWVRGEAAAPFDLYDSPLFYIALFKVGELDYGFMLKAHHIICDGWSMDVLTKGILGEYRHLQEGRSAESAEPEPSYLEYLTLEQQYLTSERFHANRQFWEHKFQSLPEPLFEKNSVRLQGSRATRTLDREFTASIKARIGDYNLSLPLFLTAALGLLFSRYYQKPDLVLAIPVANRSAATKPMVGMFTGTLPLRLHIQGNLCLRTYLQRVRREFNHSLANHRYPYDLLVQDLELRKKGYDSLYQVAFNYYNTHLNTEMDGVGIANEEFYSGEQAYPIQLLVKEWTDDGTLSFSFDYQKDQFSDEEVDVLFECLFWLLRQMLDDPERPLKELELLTECQYEQSIHLFNVVSRHEYPQERTVTDLFQETVRRCPDRVAVSHGDRSLTYRELAGQVNRLSLALTAEYSPKRRTVGIMMGHSPKFVVAVLAVLQAGASFLPIDPALPPARVAFMLREAEAACLLFDNGTDREAIAAAAEVPAARFAELASRRPPENVRGQESCRPEELAYIIYTSGSTGQPKGVMIPHSNLANYVTWATAAYQSSEQDVFAFYSSISFDLTLTSLFVPLVSGAQIRIYEQSGDEYILHRILRENKATMIKLTPSHLALMDIQPAPGSVLRTLVVGGESLKTVVAAKIQQLYGQGLTIYNEYGPTEATVGCMIHRFDLKNDRGAAVPIGIPAANAKLYVLDANLKPLPPGAVGELYISGNGVAAGYLQRPDMTAGRFLPDPFSEGDTMYRTGDLVRFGAPGRLEYIGRNDSQIKVRGYRIETEEIEQCLLAYEGIRGAVVLAQEVHQDTELIAYIVCGLPEQPGLKRWLADRLPAYMIPHQIVDVPEIPLTANGKVDQERLVQYAPNQPPLAVESRSATHEDQLLSALKKVLERESVSLEDQFFHIGGDSIKAIQISGTLKSRGLRLSAADILDHPLVKDMALCITEEQVMEPQGPAEGSVQVTPIISWLLSRQLDNPNHYLQSMLLEVKSEVPRGVIEDALKAVIRHHDSLRLCYDAEQRQLFYNESYDADSFRLTDMDLRMYPANQLERRLEEHAAAFKRELRFDGGEGLAFRACLVHMGGERRCLLLAAHHICIDGVSWRILLEDVAGWIKSGGKQPLPPKTSAYGRWAAAMAENGEALFQSELAHWMKATGHLADGNFAALAPPGLLRQDCREHTVTLGRPQTEALLGAVEGKRSTAPEEVLQTALVLALHEVFACGKLLIWTEGHGREPLFPDLNLSRTVGWFTSLYPVPVRVDGGLDRADNRQRIREQLRNIPHKGIGYGVLAYTLNRLKPAATGEVLFNYLGEFPLSYGEGVLRLMNHSTGPDIAGENQMPYGLEINAYVLNRELHISLLCAKGSELDRGMERFINAYTAIITDWTAQTDGAEAGELTPSDFEEVELSQQEFDSLFN